VEIVYSDKSADRKPDMFVRRKRKFLKLRKKKKDDFR
jgi:hypothetical protein